MADSIDQWVISKWRLRITGLLLVISLGLVALFGFLFVGKENGQSAFEHAPVCAAGSTSGCVIRVDTRISRRSQSSGQSAHQYYLTLAGPAPAYGRITMSGAGAWDLMYTGDEVTATVWNGQIVSLTDRRTTGETASAPSLQTAVFAALFASAVVWAAAFVLLDVRILEAARGRAHGWSRVLIPLVPGACVALALFPLGSLAAVKSGSALVTVLAGAALTVLAGSYFVVNWARRRRPAL